MRKIIKERPLEMSNFFISIKSDVDPLYRIEMDMEKARRRFPQLNGHDISPVEMIMFLESNPNLRINGKRFRIEEVGYGGYKGIKITYKEYKESGSRNHVKQSISVD